MQPLILHIVHSISPGGTERVLASMTSALSRRGTRHAVCALRRLGTLRDMFDPDVEVMTLGERGANRLLFRKLAAALRSLRPAVIHARNWGTWTDAVLASRFAPGPRVLLGFQGLQEGVGFSRMQRVRAAALGMRRLDCATVSDSSRDLLVDDLGFDSRRITTIKNGVDIAHYRPASESQKHDARMKWGLKPDDFVIVSTGAFKPVKRHGVMLDALAEITRVLPNARLLLAGYGRLEDQIRARVFELGLSNHVRFTGWLPDVRNALSVADVYVCASRFEGLSNSVLEAMAMGLAFVVTDVSDHRDMFARFDPDAVVGVDDVDQIARRLCVLAGCKELRRKLGEAARCYVERQHDFQMTIDAYDRLYKRLCIPPADSLLDSRVHESAAL